MIRYNNLIVSYTSCLALVDRALTDWDACCGPVPETTPYSLQALTRTMMLSSSSSPNPPQLDTGSPTAPHTSCVPSSSTKRGLYQVCAQHPSFHGLNTSFDTAHKANAAIPYPTDKARRGQWTDTQRTYASQAIEVQNVRELEKEVSGSLSYRRYRSKQCSFLAQ